MGFNEVLRLLDGSHPVEDAVRAYEDGKRELDRQRREHLVALGVAPDDACPAARIYHDFSAISREWTPRLTSEESHALAMDLGYKSYPDAAKVALPAPAESSPQPVMEAIRTRRSTNEFADVPVAFEVLSALLRGACGVTRSGSLPLRAAPSAGALYPVEVYVLAFDVTALAPGLYHYAPVDDALDRVADIPDRSRVVADVLAPGLADITPPVMIALTAVLPRVEAKYGERGYRFSLLEAGHIGQNLALLAGGYGLVSTTIGGFCDADLNRLLDVSDAEVALYLFLCGSPVAAPRDQSPVE